MHTENPPSCERGKKQELRHESGRDVTLHISPKNRGFVLRQLCDVPIDAVLV
jgi:hypothetical protein